MTTPQKSAPAFAQRFLFGVAPLLILFAAATQARAVPILQVYLEGSTYNTETESWELSPPGSSAGEPFRLWVIGNVDGPGGQGTIFDVRLAIAYSEEDLGLSISLTPSTAGGDGSYEGFVDPSVSGTFDALPTSSRAVQTSLGEWTIDDGPVVTNGSTPVLGDGRNLPSHGTYGPGTVWQEYALGDFTLTDSHVGDFIGSFPTELSPASGQINVYEVSVMGGSGATIHFDAYNHVEGKVRSRYVFSPFSHDADADANIVPEPATMLAWSIFAGAGLCVACGRRFRRRKNG